MKKFKFSLDSVLSYKQQILDALQAEHGVLLAQVRTKEEEIRQLWRNYRRFNGEYQHKVEMGLPMTDVLMHQSQLRAMEREIRRETLLLEDLKKKEDGKRAEVIQAKKETISIEKLREKKLTAYHKEEAKNEERLIEEFVSVAQFAGGSVL